MEEVREERFRRRKKYDRPRKEREHSEERDARFNI